MMHISIYSNADKDVHMKLPLRIGIDIGGTFTDAIAVSAEGISTTKVPSNPANPGEAVLAAVEALNLGETPERFLHGTTLVTNMLLERKGAETGFITSQGMRDILHIGRHERPLTYAIKQEIPHQHHPPVPRKRRLTVPERVDAQGEVITPLDEAAVRQSARELVKMGAEAIGIGFLHSYQYLEHEKLAEEWVREEAPDAFICTSSEVSPRFREYERFLTTAWNARVAPGAARYLSNLVRELDTRWPGLKLTLMTSNGGLEEVDMQSDATHGDLRRTPIRLGLSGPAAAGNAITRVAHDLDLNNCVGLDVGGTSSDIVVVREGRLREAPWEERKIGGYVLQIPMLDLHTIGAGGGSLVFRDEFGALHVGPQSAGADPGPACYNRGGTQATVTDAAAVVGRLPANILLGGSMPIHVDLAHKAIAETFGVDDQKEIIRAALQVLALAEANIAFGIRERTVARGLDPAELALVAAGGAGPLLACGVAETLGLAEVIVPHRPGLLAAWGLLVAPDRREATITVLRLLSEITPEEARAYYSEAEKKISTSLPEGAKLLRIAALRYLGQGFEVEILVNDPNDIDSLAKKFHEAHQHEYGFSIPEAEVEWIELRAFWEVPAIKWAFPLPGNQEKKNDEQVPVWEFGQENDETRPELFEAQAKYFDRDSLRTGMQIEGPVIITEQDATTYIPTGWKAHVTDNGYLRVKKKDK
jgi:N-methylhydantoinase A/oxoprolinase/acetone carboxylase beta subunit